MVNKYVYFIIRGFLKFKLIKKLSLVLVYFKVFLLDLLEGYCLCIVWIFDNGVMFVRFVYL